MNKSKNKNENKSKNGTKSARTTMRTRGRSKKKKKEEEKEEQKQEQEEEEEEGRRARTRTRTRVQQIPRTRTRARATGKKQEGGEPEEEILCRNVSQCVAMCRIPRKLLAARATFPEAGGPRRRGDQHVCSHSYLIPFPPAALYIPLLALSNLVCPSLYSSNLS
jgi:hypothetical protein